VDLFICCRIVCLDCRLFRKLHLLRHYPYFLRSV
jgi:hypothetical protein